MFPATLPLVDNVTTVVIATDEWDEFLAPQWLEEGDNEIGHELVSEFSPHQYQK